MGFWEKHHQPDELHFQPFFWPTGTEPPAFTAKGHKLFMLAGLTLNPQEPMGQDAAFEELIEFLFDKFRESILIIPVHLLVEA